MGTLFNYLRLRELLPNRPSPFRLFLVGVQAQIQLVGNVVVWCSGAVGTAVYSGLLVFYLLRRRRGHNDIDQGKKFSQTII